MTETEEAVSFKVRVCFSPSTVMLPNSTRLLCFELLFTASSAKTCVLIQADIAMAKICLFINPLNIMRRPIFLLLFVNENHYHYIMWL